MSDGETIGLIILGIVMSFLLGLVIGLEVDGKNLEISQETGDKICLDLTEIEGVVAEDWWDYNTGKEPIDKGELYCKIPTYDETPLIKVGT